MARNQMTAAHQAPSQSNEMIFRLGLQHATAATRDDRVAAHKWFNIAAMQGNADAVRLRCEIAAEMSAAEIAQAQREARNWITHH